jgi:hypothetical protein
MHVSGARDVGRTESAAMSFPGGRTMTMCDAKPHSHATGAVTVRVCCLSMVVIIVDTMAVNLALRSSTATPGGSSEPDR